MQMKRSRKADNCASRRYLAYLAAALIAVAAPSSAQSVCNTTPVIYSILSGKHGESTAARGMTRGGELLEMWANRDTGSWSLLITRPDGITCLVQAGQNFNAVPVPPNL